MKTHHAKNAHKSGHPHHANEMAHHKMRDSAKSRHESHKASEHGTGQHAAMHEHGAVPKHLLGGSVNDSHQQGIARKVQKPGSMEVGQGGSMSGGWEHRGLKDNA